MPKLYIGLQNLVYYLTKEIKKKKKGSFELFWIVFHVFNSIKKKKKLLHLAFSRYMVYFCGQLAYMLQILV